MFARIEPNLDGLQKAEGNRSNCDQLAMVRMIGFSVISPPNPYPSPQGGGVRGGGESLSASTLIAGIGCRKGAAGRDILAAIDVALADCGLAPSDLHALAAIPQKQGETGLREAAAALGLPLRFPAEEDLAGVETPTRSQASLDATGLPSASEAAALAAAGPGAHLVRPRIVLGHATCAIAVCGDRP